MLHCLVQTEAIGGDNQVTDALHITKKLKTEKPDVYRVLTETQIDWYDIGQESGYAFHSLYRSPVIL
jgi:hypothetical protein